jgi:hypothetical protein
MAGVAALTRARLRMVARWQMQTSATPPTTTSRLCLPRILLLQGMRDLGLESFGAQLSLLGKQVASSLNAILPAELNPFAFDEEEYDDGELAAAAAAK